MEKGDVVTIVNPDDQYYGKSGFISKILLFDNNEPLYSVFVYECEKKIIYNKSDLQPVPGLNIVWRNNNE